MEDSACPFCFPDFERVFHEGKSVLGLWDGFPVSPGHALLVPRRHVATWFDATREERAELTEAIDLARDAICAVHSPDGFNLGVNVGAAAGQSVFHLHLHVIPRYSGDVAEPRGGVRHVIPGRGNYRVGLPVPNMSGQVRDADPVYAGTTDTRPETRPIPSAATGDATGFGERMLQLLDEGRFTTTYKYAVLLALIDVCVELGPDARPVVTTRRLAERVLEIYWPQTAAFQGRGSPAILSQSLGGQAELLASIRRFREREGADPSDSLSRARLRHPERYERLLSTVEWKLIEMPLPRLQTVGNTQLPLLYRIGWNSTVRRTDVGRKDFDRGIHLQPGAVENLLRFSGLLRPLIQQAWIGMVARMNRDATDEARLHEFLFGARRISLDPVRADLRELQDNRCFYCDRRIAGAADVDHFVPWSRHADNGIDNLVVADPRCNNDKRDFLPAGGHVDRWAERFDPASSTGQNLADIAARSSWERHPERTINAARSIYTRLPRDVRLWRGVRDWVSVADEQDTLGRVLRDGSTPSAQSG